MVDGDFDLFVIGAGSGGLATSKRAAAYGARVAIAEADRVGGTCVIRGCIPKKLMVYAAEHGHAAGDAAGYGWRREGGDSQRLHWPTLVVRRNEAVAGLERAHVGHLERAGVRLIEGRARLLGAHEVAIGDRRFTARYVVLATGGAPILPPIEGVEHALTSDGFFELEQQPRSAIVVGGGYIAVELASIMAGLGTAVTLIIRRDRPLRGFDDDLRSESLKALRALGIDVRTDTTISALRPAAGGVECAISTPDGASVVAAERAVVYAIGRRPNSAELGLETLGVELGSNGRIVVDDDDRTSLDGVFAIGDVTDRVPLTPVAIQAGRALADRLFGGRNTHMSYDGVPTAVFGEPPIATVGLTEAQARERLGDDAIAVHSAGFTPLVHMLTERKVRTFIKMIVEKSTDRVLGCHMIGHDAPEIIQGLAIAMKAGVTKADFDATVGIHPSTAEEFVTFV